MPPEQEVARSSRAGPTGPKDRTPAIGRSAGFSLGRVPYQWESLRGERSRVHAPVNGHPAPGSLALSKIPAIGKSAGLFLGRVPYQWGVAPREEVARSRARERAPGAGRTGPKDRTPAIGKSAGFSLGRVPYQRDVGLRQEATRSRACGRARALDLQIHALRGLVRSTGSFLLMFGGSSSGTLAPRGQECGDGGQQLARSEGLRQRGNATEWPFLG